MKGPIHVHDGAGGFVQHRAGRGSPSAVAEQGQFATVAERSAVRPVGSSAEQARPVDDQTGGLQRTPRGDGVSGDPGARTVEIGRHSNDVVVQY